MCEWTTQHPFESYFFPLAAAALVDDFTDREDRTDLSSPLPLSIFSSMHLGHALLRTFHPPDFR